MKTVKTGFRVEGSMQVNGPLSLNDNLLVGAKLDKDYLELVNFPETSSIQSLHLSGNQLIIAYNDYDYSTSTQNSRTKTVNLTPFAADVQITGATITQPSAGVWMLNITESNGDVNQVNLADLVAVNVQNPPASNVTIEGNGTVNNPLRAVFHTIETHQVGHNGTDLETYINNLQSSLSNIPKAITFNIEKTTINLHPIAELILKVPFGYFPHYNTTGDPQHQFVASVRQTLDNFMYSEEIVTPFTCMRNEQGQFWEFNFGIFDNLPGGVDYITVTIIQNTVSHGDVADAEVSFRLV